MALEQPFSHWPFSASDSDHIRHQTAQIANGNLKRYDINDSPFRDISPIPNGGRDFGTFPLTERQPKSTVRKQQTQDLSNRVSKGFQPEITRHQHQFMPIPENPPNNHGLLNRPNRISVGPQAVGQEQQPRRGLSLMSRYEHDRSEKISIKRSNSLLDFAEFIGKPREQTPQSTRPIPVQQHSSSRNANLIKQPQRGVHPEPVRSSMRQPRAAALPNFRPTEVFSYPNKYSQMRSLNLRGQRRRQRPRETSPYTVSFGICCLVTGLIILAASGAACIALSIVNNAWPTSALFLIGVFLGSLMMVVGMMFVCNRCLSLNDDEENYGLFLPNNDSYPIETHNGYRSEPFLQESFRRSTHEHPTPMNGFVQHSRHFPSEPMDLEQSPIDDLGLDNREPEETTEVPNGVPAPLAFTSLVQATPNEYMY